MTLECWHVALSMGSIGLHYRPSFCGDSTCTTLFLRLCRWLDSAAEQQLAAAVGVDGELTISAADPANPLITTHAVVSWLMSNVFFWHGVRTAAPLQEISLLLQQAPHISCTSRLSSPKVSPGRCTAAGVFANQRAFSFMASVRPDFCQLPAGDGR